MESSNEQAEKTKQELQKSHIHFIHLPIRDGFVPIAFHSYRGLELDLGDHNRGNPHVHLPLNPPGLSMGLAEGKGQGRIKQRRQALIDSVLF